MPTAPICTGASRTPQLAPAFAGLQQLIDGVKDGHWVHQRLFSREMARPADTSGCSASRTLQASTGRLSSLDSSRRRSSSTGSAAAATNALHGLTGSGAIGVSEAVGDR